MTPARPGSKRERTRRALLAAAAALVGEVGLANVTLQAIASRAGMSRGAIYGNFSSREELLLALGELCWKPVIPRFRLGASFREHMHALAEAVIAAAPERAQTAVGAASFQLQALTDPAMRERLAAANASLYQQSVQALLKFSREQDLPMPATLLVRVLHAMIEGILMQRCLSPEHITDDVIFAAFAALAPVAAGREAGIESR